MKYINKIIIVCICIIILTGCSTTEKFKVSAPQGTKVYTPYQPLTPAAVIHQSQTPIKMEVPSDMYCGYLLAKTENFPYGIPFGLDYTNKSHIGTKVAMGAGYTLAAAGAGIEVGGLILLLASGDDEDMQSSGALITIGGLGALGAGASIGVPAHMRMRQTAYDYNFGYDKKQSFEMPKLSDKLLHPNPSKEDIARPQAKSTDRKKASSGTATQNNSKSKSTGTKAKKLKSDLSSKIIGTYRGHGKLYTGKNLEDSYSDILIIITKVDKNHVDLRVIENDEDFFESPISLTVSKSSNGNYKLSNDELNGLTVSISKKGELSFNHSQVLIDEDQFILEITAKR